MHVQSIEQANQGEHPVYLATLAACDRESAVLGSEPLECVDENMHPGRVHERDPGQIHDDRTGVVLENRQ